LNKEKVEKRKRDLEGMTAQGSGGEGRDQVGEFVPFEDSEAVVVNGSSCCYHHGLCLSLCVSSMLEFVVNGKREYDCIAIAR
jgi:hypothetical protein